MTISASKRTFHRILQALGVFGVQMDGTFAEMLPGLRVPSGVIVTGRAQESRGADVPLAAGDVIAARRVFEW